MSKLVLNVSDKTYEAEDIKQFLKKEQELRKALKVNPFIEDIQGLETWKIDELFPDDLDGYPEDFSWLMPEHTIPWNLEKFPIKVYFKEGNNYLRVTKEQREAFANECKDKSVSFVLDKLYEGDVLIIQDDLLRYPNDWMGSINEFVAYGANVNKEYLINQYFEVLD